MRAVPPERLPAAVRRGLRHVAPAVIAALLATSLAGHGHAVDLGTLAPRLLALAVAGIVTWRTRNLALTVAAAVGVLWLLTL